MARDLAANSDDATVRAAIGALGPAIELADLDSAGDDVEEALARDIWQRHVILGPKDSARAGAKLEGLTGKLIRNGKDAAVPTDLEIGTGKILDTVRHVADVTAAMGDGLRAGQFIICGDLSPARCSWSRARPASTPCWLQSDRCRCGLLGEGEPECCFQPTSLRSSTSCASTAKWLTPSYFPTRQHIACC